MHVRSLLGTARPVPPDYRAKFRHLYLDIAWYGVLAASALSFVSVYAARQGASAFQIGLLTAGPAVVNLFFTLPAGRWLEGQPVGPAVFWLASLNRFFYLLWVPLPLFLGAGAQVWTLVGLTLVMSVPGTGLAIGFNALFADVVPAEWRGHVVGIRNALLSITFILVSLLCGQILDRLPFPTGYQVVFGLGFLGAAMSTFHIWFLAPHARRRPGPRTWRGLGDLAGPGRVRQVVDSLRPGIGLRFLIRPRKLHLQAPEILRGSFGKLVVVFFCFYLTLNLAIPLFPLHWVNNLKLSDADIGLGTAVFYVSVLISSMQLARLVQHLGNQRLTAIGALFMSSYPAFMGIAHGLGLFLVGSALGGLGWSLVSGALTNYLLEKIPADRRPVHLAWYNLALNGALLLGSLVGPFVAGLIGLPLALLVFAGLRLLAALLILRWE